MKGLGLRGKAEPMGDDPGKIIGFAGRGRGAKQVLFGLCPLRMFQHKAKGRAVFAIKHPYRRDRRKGDDPLRRAAKQGSGDGQGVAGAVKLQRQVMGLFRENGASAKQNKGGGKVGDRQVRSAQDKGGKADAKKAKQKPARPDGIDRDVQVVLGALAVDHLASGFG